MTLSHTLIALILSLFYMSVYADLDICKYQIKSAGNFQNKWVDLNRLANSGGYSIKDDSGWDNLINFCNPVSKTCTGASQTMGVQTYQDGQCNTLSGPIASLASQISIKEDTSAGAASSPDIVLLATGGQDGRAMQITCHCKEGAATEIQWINQSPVRQYNFRAFSQYCCASDSIGGGYPFLFPVGIFGIFLILAIIAFALYWPIGAVINKFIRKKEGIEIIPNVALWKDLPFLFWEGFSWLPQVIIRFIKSKRGGAAGGYEEP